MNKQKILYRVNDWRQESHEPKHGIKFLIVIKIHIPDGQKKSTPIIFILLSKCRSI